MKAHNPGKVEIIFSRLIDAVLDSKMAATHYVYYIGLGYFPSLECGEEEEDKLVSLRNEL